MKEENLTSLKRAELIAKFIQHADIKVDDAYKIFSSYLENLPEDLPGAKILYNIKQKLEKARIEGKGDKPCRNIFNEPPFYVA